jgi:hypothetical protein
MAKADTVKTLMAAMLHMRNCTIRPTETCKECMQGIMVQSAALAESVDIADAMRLAIQKAQGAQLP